MILTSNEMKQAEKNSKLSEYELIQIVGKALFESMKEDITKKDNILILAGNGNNGADGIVLSTYLNDNGYKCSICFPYLEPNKETAKIIFKEYKYPIIKKEDISKHLKKATIVVDSLYGFSFHGTLPQEIQSLFSVLSSLKCKIYSIDLNSGAESDTSKYDSYTVRSDITYALGTYKPFHALSKEHELCKKIKLVPLPISFKSNTYKEMNEEIFFKNYPVLKENAYKNTFGKVLLIGGSYSMAGAISFNIIGARSMGASFIEVGLPDSIYPIVSSNYLYPVYHPFNDSNYMDKLTYSIEHASCVSFGSGATYMPHKEAVMNLIIEKANAPIVFDAEALYLLKDNMFILKYAKKPIIFTPHIGEFSALTHLSIEEINQNKIELAKDYATKNNVYLILKGANTIIASPSGELYINNTGNPSLATAGSGDLLTGMISALLTKQKDIFTALCMSVFMHGYLADNYITTHSKIHLDFNEYISLSDSLFYKHGF